jgi:hypothetical protein
VAKKLPGPPIEITITPVLPKPPVLNGTSTKAATKTATATRPKHQVTLTATPQTVTQAQLCPSNFLATLENFTTVSGQNVSSLTKKKLKKLMSFTMAFSVF